MSDPITIGAITVAAASGAIAPLYSLIKQKWNERKQVSGNITVKLGDQIVELTSNDLRNADALLEAIERQSSYSLGGER